MENSECFAPGIDQMETHLETGSSSMWGKTGVEIRWVTGLNTIFVFHSDGRFFAEQSRESQPVHVGFM